MDLSNANISQNEILKQEVAFVSGFFHFLYIFVSQGISHPFASKVKTTINGNQEKTKKTLEIKHLKRMY